MMEAIEVQLRAIELDAPASVIRMLDAMAEKGASAEKMQAFLEKMLAAEDEQAPPKKTTKQRKLSQSSELDTLWASLPLRDAGKAKDGAKLSQPTRDYLNSTLPDAIRVTIHFSDTGGEDVELIAPLGRSASSGTIQFGATAPKGTDGYGKLPNGDAVTFGIYGGLFLQPKEFNKTKVAPSKARMNNPVKPFPLA